MATHHLKTQTGLGLIQAIAGLAIVSVAAVSLFLSAHYARNKVVQNHHYRLALLKAMSELEVIKWNYPDFGVEPVDISFYSYQFNLDEFNNSNLEATLTVDRQTESDTSISLDTKNSIITVKITWDEQYDLLVQSQTVTRSIALRDDYFYRAGQ